MDFWSISIVCSFLNIGPGKYKVIPKSSPLMIPKTDPNMWKSGTCRHKILDGCKIKNGIKHVGAIKKECKYAI